MQSTRSNKFVILEHNKVLSNRANPSNPDKREIVSGSVARLVDGTLLARSMSRDLDGSILWSYGLYDAEADRAALDPPWFKPNSFYRAKIAELEFNPGLHTMEPAASNGDYAAFARDYPDVAKKLGIHPLAAAPGLFQTGTVQFPKFSVPRLDDQPIRDGSDGWRYFHDLHRSGNFGELGQHSPNEPLSDEEWFLVGRLSIARANDAAIASQSGCVRSRYAVPGHHPLHVLTILAGPSTRTLMYTE
jgi:hypothetical protein